MKKKIAYLTITAVIATTAFFVGKNINQPTTPHTPENLELIELTGTTSGIYLDYTDETEETFYSFAITAEELEKQGFINVSNIKGWEHWEEPENVGIEIQGENWTYIVEKQPYTTDTEVSRLY